MLFLLVCIRWLRHSGKKYKRDKRILVAVASILITAILFIAYPSYMYFVFNDVYDGEPLDKTLLIYAYPRDEFRGVYDDSLCIERARKNFNTGLDNDIYYDKLLVTCKQNDVTFKTYVRTLCDWKFKRLFDVRQTYKKCTSVVQVNGDLTQKTVKGNTISSISGYSFINGEFESFIADTEYSLTVIFDNDSMTDYGIARYKIVRGD